MQRLLFLMPVLALLGLVIGVPALTHTSRASLLSQIDADLDSDTDTGLPEDEEFVSPETGLPEASDYTDDSEDDIGLPDNVETEVESQREPSQPAGQLEDEIIDEYDGLDVTDPEQGPVYQDEFEPEDGLPRRDTMLESDQTGVFSEEDPAVVEDDYLEDEDADLYDNNFDAPAE